MGKQQVNTGKGNQTVNNSKVWERIIALENRPNNGGSGSLVFNTLADLQAAYPNGTTQPAWVVSDNAWYYWNGSVVTPPTEPTPPDTTPPVLTITPAATFTDTQNVVMSTNETATIYYTLDDTDPKTSGTKLTYSAPLTLTATDTIKAYARDTAGNESAVQTVTYTKQAPTIKNEFNKASMVVAGSYINPSGVITASAGTAYAKIPAKPNTVYSIQPRAELLSAYGRTGAARGKLAFSTDGTAITSSIDMKTETTTNNGAGDSQSYWFYFTTPANCNYILLTTLISGSDWKDTMQVEEGNTIHNYYLAYV